jgi:hypothetical protein
LNILGTPTTFHLPKIGEAVLAFIRHFTCQDKKRVALKEIVALRRRDMELNGYTNWIMIIDFDWQELVRLPG